MTKKNDKTTGGDDSQEADMSRATTIKKNLADLGEKVENIASRTFKSVKETFDKALSSRNTVLSIRVSEASNAKLSMLVDAGLFKSRSESAAFLIEEGIKHQEGLFKKIEKKLEQITKIREELAGIIADEMGEKGKS